MSRFFAESSPLRKARFLRGRGDDSAKNRDIVSDWKLEESRAQGRRPPGASPTGPIDTVGKERCARASRERSEGEGREGPLQRAPERRPGDDVVATSFVSGSRRTLLLMAGKDDCREMYKSGELTEEELLSAGSR